MMTERRHPLAECENCTLNQEDNIYVPTENPGSKLAIVGEAPGFREAKSGKPFTGPSGKLLDAVLDNYGIYRRESTITNVCLCRPPDNRTPSKAEQNACAPRLRAELANAEKIIALGNTAASAVTGENVKITKFRVGPPKRSTVFPNADIIATFHPAACLRAADNFPSMLNDIGKVNGHITVGFTPPDYRVFDDIYLARRTVQELLRTLPAGAELVVDIETAYDKDATYEPSHLIDPLCIGISYAPNKAIVFDKNVVADRGWQRLFDELLCSCRVIAHNGKFDLAWMQDISARCRLWFDTMLASYCCDERPGFHSLDYLGIEILGTPDWKAEGKKYKNHAEWYEKDRAGLLKYNAYDCAVTFQLKDYYVKRLADEGLRGLHDFLVAASNELMYMEREGIPVDEKYLAVLEERFHRELLEAEEQLKPWVANPRSTPQVKRACEALGIVEDNTKKETLMRLVCGELDLTDHVFLNDIEVLLDACRTAVHTPTSEFLYRILSYRREQKLYGTYIKGTRSRLYEGKVFPTFLLHGTTTGRLSCRNPNVQNIPRGSSIRNLFVPTNGNVFVQGDYSQAELRTIATLAKDSYLRRVFAEGRDIHGEIASSFYGENFTKEQRTRAKMVVFGLSYDMSAQGLAKRMGISKYEANKFLKQFFSVIPDVEAWRLDVQRQLFQDSGDLITPFGRHRRFHLITKENKDDIRREGLAFYPQSIASDICVSAFIKLRPALAGIASFRITVHDSLLAECAPDDAIEVGRAMREEMEAAALEFTDFVPFKVDISTGTAWGSLEEVAW